MPLCVMRLTLRTPVFFLPCFVQDLVAPHGELQATDFCGWWTCLRLLPLVAADPRPRAMHKGTARQQAPAHVSHNGRVPIAAYHRSLTCAHITGSDALSAGPGDCCRCLTLCFSAVLATVPVIHRLAPACARLVSSEPFAQACVTVLLLPPVQTALLATAPARHRPVHQAPGERSASRR